jgi:hypothetical protein
MLPIALSARTENILGFIRQTTFPLWVYGYSSGRVEYVARAKIRQTIRRFDVPVHEVNVYRRYAAETLKAFRTRTGDSLADALLLVLRKWTNLGLRPDLLQAIICDLHDKVHGMGHQMPRKKPILLKTKPGPKPGGRRKPTYEQSLKKGHTSRSGSATVKEQAASHKAGTSLAADIAAKLKPVLADRRLPHGEFIRYFAFAQKLGKLSRNYSGPSLARAASELVDLYEAKSLDRATLLAITSAVFGLSDLA